MSHAPFDVEMQLRRHGLALRRLAGEIVRDPGLAEDAVQEVWLDALRRPPPHDTALGGWLAAALRNVVRGWRRRERRRVRRELAVVAARGQFVGDHAPGLAREEQAQRLLAAVTGLATPFREAIWQRYFEGMAPREIAVGSGVPCATVKSRLQRGLQQLREKLGDEGEPGWRGALAVAFGLKGTAVPAGAAAIAWQGVVLMTTLTKSIAAVAVLAVAGVLLWSLPDRAASTSAPVAAAEGVTIAAARSDEPAVPVVGARPDERILRTPDAQKAPRTSIEVLVNNEAGEPLPGATVLFVKPAFLYSDLPTQQADRYSRSTESYLRDFGVSRLTDESGTTRIPIAAADQVVVARKGSLYGTNWPHRGGEILEIVVSVHQTLVVETVDALGKPVPHVKVVSESSGDSASLASASSFASLARLVSRSGTTLGTTDDHGILTHVLTPPAGDPPQEMWLDAELLDGPHGRVAIDPSAPPPFVRLILPATGTVRAKIQNADGSALDRRIVASLMAELSIVAAAPPATVPSGPRDQPELLYVHPDAEGNVCFENVVLGKNLQLRFPSMVVTPKAFRGPSEDQRTVTVVQTLEPDHPFVAGTLVDPEGRPMANANFSIFCFSHPDLLLAVGSKTDEQGRFLAHLTDRCIGQRGVVLSLVMEGSNLAMMRKVDAPVAVALVGKIDLGWVVMPDKK